MTNAEQLINTNTTEIARAPVAWKIAMLTDASKTVTIIFPQAPAESKAESKIAESQSVE